MSYEGYEDWLCENGHYHCYDCYDVPDQEPWRCRHCGGKVAWTNSIDDTNCDEVGKVALKRLTPPSVFPAVFQIPGRQSRAVAMAQQAKADRASGNVTRLP